MNERVVFLVKNVENEGRVIAMPGEFGRLALRKVIRCVYLETMPVMHTTK